MIIEEKYNKTIDYTKIKRNSSSNDIDVLLKSYKIIYTKEKTFDNLKYRGKLRFDFYIPECNLLIEYDGEQHYYEIEYFKNKVDDIRFKDHIKTNYCRNHNINLIRIPYWYTVENIAEILDDFFKAQDMKINLLPMFDEFMNMYFMHKINITELFIAYKNMLKKTFIVDTSIITSVMYKLFETKVLKYYDLDKSNIFLERNDDSTEFYRCIINENIPEINNNNNKHTSLYQHIEFLKDYNVFEQNAIPLKLLYSHYIKWYQPLSRKGNILSHSEYSHKISNVLKNDYNYIRYKTIRMRTMKNKSIFNLEVFKDVDISDEMKSTILIKNNN